MVYYSVYLYLLRHAADHHRTQQTGLHRGSELNTIMDKLNLILSNNPYLGNIATIIIGIVIINLLVGALQRQVAKHINAKETRYRIRRGLTFTGYFSIIVLIIGTFSNQLQNITVALGVASAGIAFALQEVIVSIAGWIALSFGQFYREIQKI